MKQITRKSVNAFLKGVYFKESNTCVDIEDNLVKMWLFGNMIAIRQIGDNTMLITNCGYKTNTTKERLNGLPNVSIQQKKGDWYLNGEKWNGKLTEIKL